jgi:hypothetical protein
MSKATKASFFFVTSTGGILSRGLESAGGRSGFGPVLSLVMTESARARSPGRLLTSGERLSAALFSGRASAAGWPGE